jgi:hypothetical protein
MAPAKLLDKSMHISINRSPLDVHLGGHILGGGKSLAGLQGPKIIEDGSILLLMPNQSNHHKVDLLCVDNKDNTLNGL